MEKIVIDILQNFSDIFGNINQPVFLIDNQHKILKINEKGKKEFFINEGDRLDDFFYLKLSENHAELISNPNVTFRLSKHSFSDNHYLIIFENPIDGLKLFKEIFNNSPLGIIIFDKAGKPILHNKAFEDLWGVDINTLKNYNLFEDDRLEKIGLLEKIKQVFTNKQILFLEGYYDSLLERGKGYTIWVESYLIPFSHNNEVEFVVMIHKDISEIKLAEEEIRIAKDQAEEANRLKNAFLQNLSHEIRTPMNAIIGFGGIISELVKDKLDQADYNLIVGFNSGIKRLHRTLTQILEISQIDTGNYQLNIQPISLREEVENVLNELKTEIEEKKLEVVLNLDEEHDTVLADKPALNRILMNLLENAVKFTPKGYIKIETYPNFNETLLFCLIKDTGIGISEEYLDHIFEPFSQEEDGFNRPYEGNGLGLALTKRYLDLINSSITVDSVKGVGSTFTFTLPLMK
ncbi:MAG: PAS domain-containing sensor histidine kinase [Ignavibacteria bacterium]|nr:PAS domain-containing sensor histidine kinase [Ignavibacteria bacterium]